MLDQRHPNIPKMQPPTDTNAYTLGSMGGHNVVIACLPKGRIGTVPAATVVTSMIAKFRSIKIGLMVGIGGGVPSNKVRLGDVVISTPIATHPGVFQWDFEKTKEGGKFERTGSLNNPPTFMKWPNLANRYLRSEALRDVLFKADCVHVDAEGTDSDEDDYSNACRYCDRTNAKEVRLRDTRVHYGIIASGNQVIKDGLFRDRLNEELGKGVLCVEMEAAGLMRNFPCLVFRGICDYADSHKNTQWQEHAAAVAAACAKEVLFQIDPEAIQAETPVQDAIRESK
ncbi:ankyrin repeat protein [Colletotrichum chrysophilum]|uniref:Ankyrin repeat protein n=1 Tax=Colletotrichum chrysophilum TaxID=1836956 RepID=A0AAD9AUJ5_9PEZI|nr:ankyrin repeat protein [Colletotrichum chrysophilum]